MPPESQVAAPSHRSNLARCSSPHSRPQHHVVATTSAVPTPLLSLSSISTTPRAHRLHYAHNLSAPHHVSRIPSPTCSASPAHHPDAHQLHKPQRPPLRRSSTLTSTRAHRLHSTRNPSAAPHHASRVPSSAYSASSARHPDACQLCKPRRPPLALRRPGVKRRAANLVAFAEPLRLISS